MSVLCALWLGVALAEPVPAITVTGRPVVLDDDGTWRYTDTPAAPAASVKGERIGAWTIDMALSPVVGSVRGGATTPNLDGPGHMGLSCRGARAEPVILFSNHPLAELELDGVPFAGEGAFVFAEGDRTRVIAGPRLFRGTVEGFVPNRVDLLEMLERSPRTELLGENVRLGRNGWPETVRFSLDGFERALAAVDAACRAAAR